MIKRLFHNEIIRYVFWGAMTTFVNLISFFLLASYTSLDKNICNVISIVIAILFAYVVNKHFVFQKSENKNAWSEFIRFIASRLFSMLIEMLGFALLYSILSIDARISKLALQVIVIVLNYFLSKFFVFQTGEG